MTHEPSRDRSQVRNLAVVLGVLLALALLAYMAFGLVLALALAAS